ncbi:MAG TPA: YHS domain-containing (seleno)protein [Candidatus Polarisedimenticolaceae bacterium]
MIRRLLSFAAVAVFASGAALAKDLVNTDASGLALQGYDAVGFVTVGKPLLGIATFTSTYEGATYRFATAEHKALFDKDPAKYAPAYGGYCAYGVAKNALAPVEISTWQLLGGRLILNKNADIKKAFDADVAGHTRDAEANWPKLVEKKGR